VGEFAINSKSSGNSGGSYAGRPSERESLWKKMIGKPYSGKPNVRFDEGELEIEPSATTPALNSTVVEFLTDTTFSPPAHTDATFCG